jgi:hypothetical protein
MSKTIVETIAGLQDLDTQTLRARWHKAFGHPAPRHMSRDLLLRALAYNVQEQAEGGLSKAVLRRLAKLADSNDKGVQAATLPAPRLRPGTRLVREWHGEIHQVIVLDNGFDYRGTRYPSLSRIAHEITGTRWSGPLFFGLRNRASSSGVAADVREGH